MNKTMPKLETDGDVLAKIDCGWVYRNAPGAYRVPKLLGALPRIPLPNTDRDSGDWWLGLDNKAEGTTVLLYCDLGDGRTVHRRLATIHSREQLIKLYEHLVGPGRWSNQCHAT